MAGQAHYTSAPPSPDAPHGGFRFTALSPAARPALDVLRPLTGYARPPGTDGDDHLPVAFAHDRPDDGTAVLTRTRPTGRDYTGRPGNHFCHALYATADELTGLRPVELWDAPHWAPSPAPDDGHALPDLTPLVPGRAVGPDRAARLLAGLGEPGVRLLERLLAVALRALAGEGSGATLVSADPDRVVDWIAAVSYALPAPLAAALTFTTYAARPQDDHHHLTGTHPETAERAPGPVFDLDRPAAGLTRPAGGHTSLDGGLDRPTGGLTPPEGALDRHLPEGAPERPAGTAPLRTGDCDRPAGAPAPQAGYDVQPTGGHVSQAGYDVQPVGGAGYRGRSAGGLAPPGGDRVPPAATPGPPAPCPTAGFLAGALASGRLDVLDAVAELWDAASVAGAGAGVRRLRTVCALLAPDGGAGTLGAAHAGLAGFVRAVVELRPGEAGLAPQRLSDAVARHLAGETSPLGDVRATLAALPEPYRRAVLAGVLGALEASPGLRTTALDETTRASLALLADDSPDVFLAAPGTALHVLRRAPGPSRPAALRILRLFRQGLGTETETYDALRDLLSAEEPEPEPERGPEPEPGPERASRRRWRRGPSARGKD
jgi:hypothetical protein